MQYSKRTFANVRWQYQWLVHENHTSVDLPTAKASSVRYFSNSLYLGKERNLRTTIRRGNSYQPVFNLQFAGHAERFDCSSIFIINLFSKSLHDIWSTSYIYSTSSNDNGGRNTSTNVICNCYLNLNLALGANESIWLKYN